MNSLRAALVLAALLPLSAAPLAAPEPATLAIVGATLIDGTGAAPVVDSVVVVREGRTVAAGPRASVAVPKDARILDAKGLWLIPGLVDAHVHFFQSGGLYTRPDIIDLRDRVPYAQEHATIEKNLNATFRRYLCSGVTAVVDVGGPMWNFDVRRRAQSRDDAPRVAVAGPLISTVSRDQFGDDAPILRADTPEEARATVRRLLRRKPDLVKIWFIRRRDQTLDDALAIVRATIAETHAAKVRVAVHATEFETARAAVNTGADILVHSVMDKPVDDEFIRTVKERGVIYTSSLVVFEGYRKVLGENVALTDVDRACGDPAVIGSWDDFDEHPEFRQKRGPRPEGFETRFQTMLANLKRMQEAGATIAAGTDAGNIGTLHGPAIHREFELMAEAGLTPMEILVAATRNAAHVFNPKPEFGTVEPGKLADLVLLEADPLADIRNVRRIRTVIKGGRAFDRITFVNATE